MKELSIEEKAKRYDEAIEKLRSLHDTYDTVSTMIDIKEELEHIFPELKESEDENIRKDIIGYLQYSMAFDKSFLDKKYNWSQKDCSKWIDWLEKQNTDISSFPKEQQVFMRKYVSFDKITLIKLLAERDANNAEIIESFEKQDEQNQNHFELKAGHWYICHRAFCCRADHLTIKEGERFMCEKDGIVKGFVIKEPEKYFKEVCAPAPIEDDQELTDKVEPKFKVGDWIVSNVSHEDYHICKILKIRNGEYVIKSIYGYQGYNNFETFDKDYHLWTIQDAKDGDVLCDETTIFIFKDLLSDGSVMSYCDYDTDSGESDAFCPLSVNLMCSKITPATKEQRDLLFQKMKESGYEWDAEKKELKKEEVDNMHNYLYGEQNPAWSEGDEEMFDAIVADIRFTQKAHNHEVNQVVYEEEIDWLKSLKDRVQPQWKPSDEQMRAIGHICDGNYKVDLDILDSIYRDFKKLRRNSYESKRSTREDL